MVSCCGNYEIETHILQVTDVHINLDPLKIIQQKYINSNYETRPLPDAVLDPYSHERTYGRHRRESKRILMRGGGLLSSTIVTTPLRAWSTNRLIQALTMSARYQTANN